MQIVNVSIILIKRNDKRNVFMTIHRTHFLCKTSQENNCTLLSRFCRGTEIFAETIKQSASE